MKIATVTIGSPILVPAGGHLDGAILAAPVWVRSGTHSIESDFAQAQEKIGMLTIAEIDGIPAGRGACCGH